MSMPARSATSTGSSAISIDWFDSEFPESYASAIRGRRVELRLTQIDFAFFLGVSKTAVVRWENCVSEPDYPRRLLLDRKLGITTRCRKGHIQEIYRTKAGHHLCRLCLNAQRDTPARRRQRRDYQRRRRSEDLVYQERIRQYDRDRGQKRRADPTKVAKIRKTARESAQRRRADPVAGAKMRKRVRLYRRSVRTDPVKGAKLREYERLYYARRMRARTTDS